jgi:hypothetical protein
MPLILSTPLKGAATRLLAPFRRWTNRNRLRGREWAVADYEVVNGPSRPGKRVDLQRLSGQRLYPVIEFEKSSIYRDESKDMAATIRAGKLDEKRAAAN